MLASPSTSMSSSSASTGYTSARTPELSEILPHLYISDVFTASDEVTLEDNGITHVISVMQPCPWLGPPPGSSFEILEINVEDSLDDTLLPYFETTNAFIQQALQQAKRDGKKAKILCHCLAGISRSVTCVVAYLMYACKMSKEEALNLVRERRPIADPNLSFLKDLDKFEAMLKRTNNKTR